MSTDDAMMNPELRKWLKERKAFKETKEKSEGGEGREPSGKCQVCGEKVASHVCLKCDKDVCTSCYFKMIGICKKCVHKDISDKWEGKVPDWEKILGIEWVD